MATKAQRELDQLTTVLNRAGYRTRLDRVDGEIGVLMVYGDDTVYVVRVQENP